MNRSMGCFGWVFGGVKGSFVGWVVVGRPLDLDLDLVEWLEEEVKRGKGFGRWEKVERNIVLFR